MKFTTLYAVMVALLIAFSALLAGCGGNSESADTVSNNAGTTTNSGTSNGATNGATNSGTG